MNRTEFVQIRHQLGKSQGQIARLLSISTKSIQSFEQGWRDVPVQAERQILFLLYLKRLKKQDIAPCWEKKNCSPQWKERCAAWEFEAGYLCWFINGTICEGRVQKDWKMKIQVCQQCEVFRSLFPLLE